MKNTIIDAILRQQMNSPENLTNFWLKIKQNEIQECE